MWLDTPDGVRLHAWLVEPPVPVVGRTLFLHGNAQNISHHLPLALWWLAAGYEVLALDYRGYGLSGGSPSIDGTLVDVRTAERWLAAHPVDDVRGDAARDAAGVAIGDAGTDPLPLVVFAQSLGASLATLWLADDPEARARVDALVLEAGFASFSDIAGDVASRFWLTWPLQWLPRLILAPLPDPVDAIGRVGVPVVVVQSDDDGIVDASNGRALYAAARAPKRYVAARGPHIRAAADPAVREAVLDFVGTRGRARDAVAPPGSAGTSR